LFRFGKQRLEKPFLAIHAALHHHAPLVQDGTNISTIHNASRCSNRYIVTDCVADLLDEVASRQLAVGDKSASMAVLPPHSRLSRSLG
jgi:hypothetical protein